MLSVSFNQDSTCFVCGTDKGFAVYNCDPPTERFNRINKKSAGEDGIQIVEMLFKSNIFALVGGGEKPKYPKNMVMIWDDFQNKCIAELEFKSPITNVKMRRDIILITIKNKTFFYKFSNLQLIKSIETFDNSSGICALSVDSDNGVAAIPGKGTGTIIIDHFIDQPIVINAHENPIRKIALNKQGDKMASVSEKGTLIRVWDTKTGKKIKELRRGSNSAEITSLAFNNDSSRIITCSNKGTVHIFSLKDDLINKKSNLIYISDYLPQYFSSEWSVISFNVPQNLACSFGDGNNVYIITNDGYYHKYVYNTIDNRVKCVDTLLLL